jgi:DNA invertase Pin-like site-specific DNA recombinase
MAANHRVAGYIRVSKDRDGLEAPTIYRSQITEWAERNGYGPVE